MVLLYQMTSRKERVCFHSKYVYFGSRIRIWNLFLQRVRLPETDFRFLLYTIKHTHLKKNAIILW